MTRAGPGFALRKLSLVQSPLDPPSRRKHSKISHRSQTVIETFTPGGSQTWSMANFVMYCGIILEVRKALGATFFCTKIYHAVEKTGSGTQRRGRDPLGRARREFRALTSAGRRHDTGCAELNLQWGAPAGAHSVQLRSRFEREWREKGQGHETTHTLYAPSKRTYTIKYTFFVLILA